MSNRKIINAASTGGIGYYPVAGQNSDAYYDNVSLLLNGDVEVDSNFANVSLLLDGNVIADKSNNKLAVTAYGNAAVTSVNKKFGTGSYYFDGTGDYIRPAASDNYMFGTGDFTVEFWVYRISGGEFFGNGPAGGGSFGIGLGATTGDTTKLQCGIYGYPAANVSCANAFPSNQWVYVAITRASGTTRIFVNGIKDGENVNGGANNSTNTASIGEVWVGSGSALNGYIDDFRITKGVARYTANFTPPVKALPTHEILDSSVYRLPVTAYGNARIDTATKKYGTGAMYFDGSGDYLTLPSTANNSINGTENFTIEAWLYPTAASAYNCIYSENYSVQIYMLSSRAINWYFSTDAASGSYFVNVSSTGTIPLNQWSHIAVTRSGNNFYGFINGVIDGTITATGSVGTSTSKSVGSFNSANSYAFTGFIDDLRITKGIARYTANFTPPTASLPTVPPTIPADPWWGNVSLLLDGNTTDAYDPYWQNVSLMLTGDDFIDWSNQHSVISGNATVNTTTKKYNSGSLYFNGSSNYLSFTSSAITFGTGNFTIEAWVYPTSYSTYNYIFANTITNGLVFYVTGSTLKIRQYNTGDILSSATIPALNTWTHVAAVRNGTNLQIYVNGTSTASMTNSTDFAASTTHYIGADSASPQAPWAGYIADLRVTKGIARTITVPTAALPSYKIQDRTQNNLTLTPYGNVQLSTDVFKNGTGSMFFDGSDYLSLSSTEIIGNGNYTIEFWLNIANSAGCGMILGTQLCHWQLGYDSNGYYLAYFNMSADYTANQVSSVRGVYGSWTHIAASRIGNTTSVYYNGVYGGGWSETLPGVSGGASQIGHSPRYSGSYLTGYIDDLRITNGYARYTQNFTPPSQSFATQYISTGYDANYADVSLLLNGNGTNGSQVFTDLSSNTKAFTNNGVTVNTTVKKYGTGSLSFNGSSNYILVGTNDASFNFGSGDFTMETWFNVPTLPNTYTRIITNFDGVVADPYTHEGPQIEISNANKLTCRFGFADGTFADLAGSTTITANIWNHVALVRQGTSVKLYLNGVADGSITVSQAQYWNSNIKTIIGAWYTNGSYTRFFNGYIDDLRITKGIARYTTNFTPPTYQLPTDTTGTVIDPLRSSTSLLLRGNGTNGSASFTDESPNGLTVTAYGNTQISTAQKKYGTGSIYFDGTGDYLSIPANSAFNFGTGDFTVESWYKSTGSNTGNAMIIGWFPSNTAGVWGLKVNGSTVRFTYNVSGFVDLDTGVDVVTDQQWHHLAVARFGTTLQIYVDGVSRWSGTASAQMGSSSQPTTLGFQTQDNTYLTGYIDDVRVTKGYARYTANFTPPTYEDPIVTGTVYDYNYPQVSLLLNGDGTNGSTTFTDLSSSPNTITPYGNTQISTTQKKFGTGSIYFDGTGDYIKFADNANFAFGTGDFTVELWFYRVTTSGDNVVLDTRFVGSDNAAGFDFSVKSDGALTIYYNGSSRATSTNTMPLNSWTYVTLVRSGNTLTSYINGVVAFTISGFTNNLSETARWIGTNWPQNLYLKGYIDDFRITKGIARYTSNFTPPTAPLPTSYS